jgi:hypothetical protein
MDRNRMSHGLDQRCVDLIELAKVVYDAAQLLGQYFQFSVVEPQSGEQRKSFDIRAGESH